MHKCPCLQANTGDQSSSTEKNLPQSPERLFAQYNCNRWVAAAQVTEEKVVKRLSE